MVLSRFRLMIRKAAMHRRLELLNAEILANRVLGSLVLCWVTTFALADSHPRTVTNEISRAGSHSAAAPLAISKAEISASGAPNIVILLTDDVGFSASSTFGGPIPTPNLDRLAREGLVFNRFHTTGVCAPTRAALLTGRNHHSVGTGHHPEMATPYPGYTGVIPKTAATIARILRDHGYATAMFGKDHNVPPSERSPAGPFNNWPTSRGFEYFYGFLAGDTDQFQPALFEGTQPVDGSLRPTDYIFDKELVDKVINWLHTQKAARPEKPVFMYQAFGTAHAPQQAPPNWRARFKGWFDDGWDAAREHTLARQLELGLVPQDTTLARRPDAIKPWSALSEPERRVNARFMEVYAGMLAYQDHQFGRFLDELERMGIRDNTLIFFIQGDNGAAVGNGLFGSLNELRDMSLDKSKPQFDIEWLADNLDIMGGPFTYQAIPAGWSLALNAPFPLFKRIASHLGATRNGLVVSWPKEIKKAGIRSQFHHVIDVAPTILDVVDIVMPQVVDGEAQQSMDGVSMRYVFDAPEAANRRLTQYFEIGADRGVYHDGWFANTTPVKMPWDRKTRETPAPVDYDWELYHLDTDFSQTKNLASQYPEKLAELIHVFDSEALRNQVLPLQNSSGRERAAARGYFDSQRTELVLWGANVQVGEALGPRIFNRSFRVEAEISIQGVSSSGVIFAAGSYFGGWSFHLDNGVPVATSASSPLLDGRNELKAKRGLGRGTFQIRWEVRYRGSESHVSTFIDNDLVAEGVLLNRPVRMAGQGELMESGQDSNVSVADYEKKGGVFSGSIHKVTVALLNEN